MRLQILISLLLLTFLSCGKEDKIDPAFDISSFKKTLKDKQHSDSILISYGFSDFKVDRVGETIGRFPILGGVFQRVTEALADVVIQDGKEHEIPPTVFTLEKLDDLDFSLLESLSIRNVEITASQIEDDSKASLTFIKGIVISLCGLDPVQHLKMNNEENDSAHRVKLLSYERDQKSLSSSLKNIVLKSNKKNLKPLLKKYRKFKVHTKMIVDSVPKAKMNLNGTAHFLLKISPGF